MTGALRSISNHTLYAPEVTPMHANGNSFGWTPPGDARPRLEAPIYRWVAGHGMHHDRGVNWG